MPTAACLRMRPLAGAGPVERDVLARLPDVAPLEAEHVHLVGRRLSPSGDAVGAGLASGRIVRLYALSGQRRRPRQRFATRVDLVGNGGAPVRQVTGDFELDRCNLDAAELGDALRKLSRPPSGLAAEED